MKTTDAKPLIDSIQAGEVEIDAISNPNSVILRGRMAFVNAGSGRRIGSMNKSSWSEETWTKLRALLDSMEQDALREVFGEAATAGGELPLTTTSDGAPGL